MRLLYGHIAEHNQSFNADKNGACLAGCDDVIIRKYLDLTLPSSGVHNSSKTHGFKILPKSRQTFYQKHVLSVNVISLYQNLLPNLLSRTPFFDTWYFIHYLFTCAVNCLQFVGHREGEVWNVRTLYAT